MGVLGAVRNSVYRLRQYVFFPSMVAHPFNFAMLSHPGRVRKGNEDTCAASIDAGAFVVCDGMGGAAGGEVASALAAERFLQVLRAPSLEKTPRTATPDVRLAKAVTEANQVVYGRAQQLPHLRGMGTTLIALLLEGKGRGEPPGLTLAHVGDSRCYRFRAGELTQLTADHSLVEEQVRSGDLTPLEAAQHPYRNIITRAVGSQPLVKADILPLEAEPGDLYLLASDGLTRELADEEIAATLNRAYLKERQREQLRQSGARASDSAEDLALSSPPPTQVLGGTGRGLDLASLCQTLVDQANDAGGGDNITVLLVLV